MPQTAAGLMGFLAALLLPDQAESAQGARKAATTAAGDRPSRRTDLRLAPSALLAWAAAVAGVWLPLPALGVLIGALLLGAAALVAAGRRRRFHTPPGRQVHRTFLTTLTIALLLAAAVASHSAVAASQKHDGPVADAVTARSAVVVQGEVSGPPRQLKAPGRSGADRWAVPATASEIIANGALIRADAQLLILGGGDWGHVVPGQRIRTTGKMRPAEEGQAHAAILSASTGPATTVVPSPWLEGPGSLRREFAAAADWIGGDARGLLPGMVTGDTSLLDEQLEAAMKTVGMTHLTAVSGANCSLILGALLLAARSLRLARFPAAAVALAGLGLFVLMVGPDASVLRASLMGAVAVASLAGGRSGRGLSFLCLAVIALLLAEPELGVSFGFLLSVLATLGIIVLGRSVMAWFPSSVPRWLAAAVAVPLSAQLLCGPVIVVLQPQFSTYSLLANVLVAPLVAPVTILGTAAVALLPLVPWLSAVLIGVAGFFAGVVAAVARFTAGLPGAAPPWPEGVFGLLTMLLFSVVTLLSVWMAAHPAGTIKLVLAAHARTARFLDRLPEAEFRPVRFRGQGRLRVCDLRFGAASRGVPTPANEETERVSACRSLSGPTLQRIGPVQRSGIRDT
ncbi:ComEC/Rec2 family competence protein [Arthrobacter sp. ISL-72]|uniref:ComEC/Rec2 family competence protein n=1 Tax=Arthrobacter sp. ISL-72 TaxID=2819114 RepID=UPI002889EB96|nr:ComEC/Rec2 family competence protein [Arthrobacter sp. ISL-72]